MDFFGAQDSARRRTFWLLLYLFLCLLLIVVAVYLTIWGLLNWASTEMEFEAVDLFVPRLFFWVAGGTCFVIGCCALFKLIQLSAGGAVVAQMLGGRELPPNTGDADERRLLNVVEEMAIASGLQVPPVYVLDDEAGINAFAAGHSPNTAVVAVTAGTLRLLNRDELQGVIGHEFSHILNGDMKINLRLIAILFGILGLFTVGWWIFRVSLGGRHRLNARNKGSAGPAFAVLGLALMAIGGIGLFFGKLIKAAISRQREFLADAAAVQFTRNPAGIAGALKKIGGYGPHAQIDSTGAEEAAHLFFADGLSASFLNMMATHPPLVERIRAIEPAFDGRFPKVEAPSDLCAVSAQAAIRNVAIQAATGQGPDAKLAAAALAGLAARPAAASSGLGRAVRDPSASGLRAGPTSLDPDQVLAQVGRISPDQMRYAEQLMFEIPGPLLDMAHEPLGAAALICGLLLDSDPLILDRQLAVVVSAAHPAVNRELAASRKHLRDLAPDLRLKLLDLAIPALRQLAPTQYQQLQIVVDKLIAADQKTSLFEFMLIKLMRKHLDTHFSGRKPPPVQFYSLRQLGNECSILLTFVARAGVYGLSPQSAATVDASPEKADAAAAAFLAGERLLNLGNQHLQTVDLGQLKFERLDAALRQFQVLAPGLKKRVIAACAAAIAVDKVVLPAEAELFRAIAAAIDCPVPPLFSTPAAA